VATLVHPNQEGISQAPGMKEEAAHHQKVGKEGKSFVSDTKPLCL
jgi:hypothetical protein